LRSDLEWASYEVWDLNLICVPEMGFDQLIVLPDGRWRPILRSQTDDKAEALAFVRNR
jgi:hypothetical protein